MNWQPIKSAPKAGHDEEPIYILVTDGKIVEKAYYHVEPSWCSFHDDSTEEGRVAYYRNKGKDYLGVHPNDDEGHLIGFWYTDAGYVADGEHGSSGDSALRGLTHWMPLPEVPE